MATPTVDYLSIGGGRYAVRDGRFTRSHLITELPQIKARRPESPFLDADVSSFEAGVKPDQMDDTANWVKGMVGLEPTSVSGTPPYISLKVARALAQDYSAAGSGELVPMVAGNGRIYAGEWGSDKVLYSTDGVTWTAVSTGSGSTAGVSVLFTRGTSVIAGFLDKSQLYASTDGGLTWALSYNVSNVIDPLNNTWTGTATGVSAIVRVGRDAPPSLTNLWGYTYLIIGENYWGSGADARAILVDIGSVSGGKHVIAFLDEGYARAACADGATAYICGANVTNQVFGHLYSFDRTSDQLTHLDFIDGNYATSAAFYKGKSYWGCLRGELYVYDGSEVSLLRTFTSTLPMRGMEVFAGALWVSVYNTTDSRLEVWRYDGTAWTLPYYVTATLTAAGQMVAFSDRLHVAAGDGAGPTRKVYGVSATNRATTAILDTPERVYGAPTLLKRFRRFALQHSALQAGQAVQASYSLDGAAYAALLTNKRYGSTQTVVDLPDSALGGRAGPRWTLTNDPALDLTLYGDVARALAAPAGRELWEATLMLAPVHNDPTAPTLARWRDGTADAIDAIRKWELLADLRGRTFQVAEFARDGASPAMPRRAMLATFDPQTPFGATFGLIAAGADVQAEIPVRLLQAGGPVNLLDNASFEQDAAGIAPTGWTPTGTGTSAVVNAAAFAADQSKVLAVTFDGVHASYGVYQTVAGLVPGRYYTASVYLRRVTTAGTVRLAVTGDSLTYATTASLGPASDTGMTRQQIAFLLPLTASGTVAVQLLGEGTPAGGDVAFWDAVMLEESVPASNFVERGA